MPSDVGRSVSQLNAFIRKHRIEELAARVIERLLPIEEKVLCADQLWYDLRVTPYRTLDHTIKGAVIVLVAAAAGGAAARPASRPRRKRARRSGPSPRPSQSPSRRRSGDDEEATQIGTATPADVDAEDTQAMLHDLDVHRLELEMQNRELREAQEQLEESRSRLADLYDFAPVAYVTLDPMGKILEANLTAAAMFGIERGNLIGKFVTTLVAPARSARASRPHSPLLRRAHPRRNRPQLRRTRTPARDGAGGERAVHRGGRRGDRMQDDAHRHHGAEAGPGTVTLLAQAAGKLVSSFDYRTTLAEVARLAVPTLADICIVDLLNPDGQIERLEVACASDAVADRARNVSSCVSSRHRGERERVGHAHATADPARRMFAGSGGGGGARLQHDALIRASAGTSMMIVPLAARDSVLGVLTFIAAESGRRFADTALATARDLAVHAATAIENARLYESARRAIRARQDVLTFVLARPAQPADRHSSHDGDVVARRARQRTAQGVEPARTGPAQHAADAAHDRRPARRGQRRGRPAQRRPRRPRGAAPL